MHLHASGKCNIQHDSKVDFYVQVCHLSCHGSVEANCAHRRGLGAFIILRIYVNTVLFEPDAEPNYNNTAFTSSIKEEESSSQCSRSVVHSPCPLPQSPSRLTLHSAACLLVNRSVQLSYALPVDSNRLESNPDRSPILYRKHLAQPSSLSHTELH